MTLPQNFAVRLSPSGPFITDAVSGEPLLIGAGTPGLVWRSQYATPQSGETDVGNTTSTPVVVPGLGGAWEFPPGYHYDVECFLTLRGGTAKDVTIILEGSINGGLSYTVPIRTTTIASWSPGVGASVQAGCVFAANMDLDWTGATVPITNVQVRVTGYDTSGQRYIVKDTWLKAEMYVT